MKAITDLCDRAYERGWRDAWQHLALVQMRRHDAKFRSKKQRLKPLSLWPLTVDQAVKAIIETGPLPS